MLYFDRMTDNLLDWMSQGVSRVAVVAMQEVTCLQSGTCCSPAIDGLQQVAPASTRGIPVADVIGESEHAAGQLPPDVDREAAAEL